MSDPAPLNDRTTLIRAGEAWLPTVHGHFRALCFRDAAHGYEHLALVLGCPGDEPTLVRVHSECMTGDVLRSLRCDCGAQAQAALAAIASAGQGVFIYLRQEGRGIGLGNKLRAYALQDAGVDTVDANLELGFDVDGRDFAVAAEILRALGVGGVRLLTNNPQKIQDLERGGVAVTARVPLEVDPNPHNAAYLAAKRQRLGHLLSPSVAR
jgi:3,4-dihydroxy 2-butanone 4-phosphate synthase/GTP cyclohydrolase II